MGVSYVPARRIVIANRKGGVGKTTTTVQLAHALALRGRRILVIDNDSQYNATSTLLGTEHPNPPRTLVDLYHSSPNFSLQDYIIPTQVPSVDLIAGAPRLSDVDKELVVRPGGETVLRRKLRDLDDLGYDYLLMDCSPSWGLVTQNAVYAADEIIVPVTFSQYAISGIEEFLNEVMEFVSEMATNLQITAVVPIAVDQRYSSRVAAFAEHVRKKWPRAAAPQIRTDGQIEQSQMQFKTIYQYNPRAKAAEDYMALAILIDEEEEG